MPKALMSMSLLPTDSQIWFKKFTIITRYQTSLMRHHGLWAVIITELIIKCSATYSVEWKRETVQ